MSAWRLAALILLLPACDGQLRFEQATNLSDAAVSGCSRDEDCGLPSLHCDVVSAECVACNDDDDCTNAQRPRCDTALHRCVGCGGDLDCGANEACLPMTRTCVQRCAEGVTERTCPASAPTCDERARICVQCQSDAECRRITDDGPYCDVASGRCMFCTDDRQCPATRPRCDHVRHLCSQCSMSRDCPPGMACDPDTLSCT